MKKLLLIPALLISMNCFSQFKDGNYKLTIGYANNLNTGEKFTGIKSIILQSSLNKITISNNSMTLVYNIINKQVSHDGITEGDMEYTAVGSNDQTVNTFIFKHRSSNSYSVNMSSLGGTYIEFYVNSINNY